MHDDLRKPTAQASDRPGSRDGLSAGDHDQPYVFGRRPSSRAPFPFTTREFARLLVLRSRLSAAA